MAAERRCRGQQQRRRPRRAAGWLAVLAQPEARGLLGAHSADADEAAECAAAARTICPSRPATTPVPRSAPVCRTSAAPACEAAGRRSPRASPCSAPSRRRRVGLRGRARDGRQRPHTPPAPSARTTIEWCRSRRIEPQRKRWVVAAAVAAGRRAGAASCSRAKLSAGTASATGAQKSRWRTPCASPRPSAPPACRTSPRGASARRCGRPSFQVPLLSRWSGGGARRRRERWRCGDGGGGGGGGGGGNGGDGGGGGGGDGVGGGDGSLRAGPPRTHRHAECATRRARSCRRKRGSIVLAVQN